MGHLKRLALTAATWCLLALPAQADPLSIGIAFLVNIGYAGTITALGATLVGAAIIGVGVVGLALLSGALAPTAQQVKPSERQQTIRQAVGPRVRYYGQVKVGGTLWFFDTSSSGNPLPSWSGSHLFVGITLNEGEISEVHEIWLNDTLCTFDGSGFITAPDTYLEEGDVTPIVRVLVKMGDAAQTVHSLLDAAFATVGTSHRLRGVANVLAIFGEVDSAQVTRVYPQYIPQVRIVMDASLIKNVRTDVVEYSNNAGDVIYDYLTAVDGAGFPYGAGFAESEVDLESFQNFATVSDEPVDLKAGGTVPRWMLAGGYAFNEDMRTVLRRMLAACDGDLTMTPSGKVGITGGEWVAPTLTLDDALGHIISGEFRRGQSALAAFNELTITYTEPTLDFQEAEAEVWIDATNQALRGRVLSEQLDVTMAPNHSQARRLGKITTKKKNPRWMGTIITNYYGMNAINEKTVTVKFSPLGIDETFEITSLKILDDLTGVQMTISSLDATAYAWDAMLEEGTGPSVPPDTSDTVITGPVTGVSGTDGVGQVDIDWTNPSDTNVAGARIYRNTVNTFGTSSRITTVYGGASEVLTYNDAVPAGTYYYWVVAINGSGLEATEVATGVQNPT